MTHEPIDFDLPQQFEHIYKEENAAGVTKVRSGLTSIMFKDILRVEEFLHPENFPDERRAMCVVFTSLGPLVLIISYNRMYHYWRSYKNTIKGRINTIYASIN